MQAKKKMTSYEKKQKAIQDADVVANLLEHAGWADVIKPKLMERANRLKDLLPQLVLSSGAQVAVGATKEQVAARIQGIDEVIALIEGVLEKGAKAFKELNTPKQGR